MTNRRHHYSCRCNDCVMQRNARRRRSADRYAETGNPLPAGAMWYEVPGDYPIRYEDDAMESDFQQQSEQTEWKWLEDAIIRGHSDGQQIPDDAEDYGNRTSAPLEVSESDHERREGPHADQEANIRHITEVQDDEMASHSSCDDFVPIPTEPAMSAPQAAPMINTASEDKNRRRLLLPLLITFALLVAILVAGTLACTLLASLGGKPMTGVVEPTPDIDSIVATTIAMMLTPSPAAPSEADNPSNTTRIATAPENDLLSSPLVTNSLPPTPPHDRLPTIECPSCADEDPPAYGYVEWIREPEVSENGAMSFRAKIDEKASFIVAGRSCGFGNLTLTDDNHFYGAIIPRSMAIECGTLPGNWIANQYYYLNDLLTVQLRIDPSAARHQGLELCLWSNGMTKEQARLLECIPIRQPQ